MRNDNRKRLIDLMKVLSTLTDEEHYLDTYEIIDEMEKLGNDRPDRKTIDPNIQFLVDELGYDIEKVKSTPNRYHWMCRNFEMAELKLMVDAILSSRFISNKQSQQIIDKLKRLVSVYQAEQLDRQVTTSNGFKRENSSVIYSIDAINKAIRNNKRIRFQMVDYDVNMREVLRYNGLFHEVSPLSLLWNNDYYYMLGIPSDEQKVKTYRVDRMKNTSEMDVDAEPKPVNFNLEKYSSRVFDMFTGETAAVQLECKPYLMNYLIDRFGKTFLVKEKRSDGSFVAEIVVDSSPTFYAWVFQFGGDARIIGPEKVKNAFIERLEAFK